MGARCRAIKQLDQVCCLTEFRQHLKECFEYPGAAQSPEPLPYAVPVAIFAGECAPCYAVDGEVGDGLQKFTVVMPRLSPARLRRIQHFQHDRPVALRHSCQHVRPSDAGHAVIRTKPDTGTRQKCMSGIPSTRPRRSPTLSREAVDLLLELLELPEPVISAQGFERRGSCCPTVARRRPTRRLT